MQIHKYVNAYASVLIFLKWQFIGFLSDDPYLAEMEPGVQSLPREQAPRLALVLALVLPVSLGGSFSLSLCLFPFEGLLVRVGHTPTAAPEWGLWLRPKPLHTLTDG